MGLKFSSKQQAVKEPALQEQPIKIASNSSKNPEANPIRISSKNSNNNNGAGLVEARDSS